MKSQMIPDNRFLFPLSITVLRAEGVADQTSGKNSHQVEGLERSIWEQQAGWSTEPASPI